MKAILFGATGMVGQGASCAECLLAADVDKDPLAGSRVPLEEKNPKLVDRVHKDLLNLRTARRRACGIRRLFFLPRRLVGKGNRGEPDYTRITYDLTLSVGRALAKLNPKMTFIYVSGEGTDSSEKGRSMWARVKGRTENDLLALPFQAFMFRPGLIQPLHGIKSKTKLYRAIYTATGLLLPLLKMVMPKMITSTEEVGIAMLEVARHGAAKKILDTSDISALANSAKQAASSKPAS